MSMLHSVTTEREADTGEAGRATHDGRSAGQPKGAPKVCRVRSRHLYCGRNQRVHVAYSRHTEGASYAQTYFTGQHCIDNLSEHAARIILGHKRAHSIGNPDGPVVGRSVTTKWWRHSSVLKWWATSYRLSWAPKRWKRILAFTITFELVS